MEGSLVQQGVSLMLFGMAVVFAFLTLLVFATGWMSSLVRRYTPEPTLPAQADQSGKPDPRLVAVISAAIHEHRQRNK
jgi:oxaloacetate decarboxylase gamma subunit